MRRLQFKFPSQIRISGWDFGSSARAMNQASRVISAQADLVKVIRSTTERKSMSTKTTIKRIALVAVAALGFGMLSTVPSQADPLSTTLTIDASDSISVGESATASLSVGYFAPTAADSVTVYAAVSGVSTNHSGVGMSVADSSTSKSFTAGNPGQTYHDGISSTNIGVAFASTGSYVTSISVRPASAAGYQINSTYDVLLRNVQAAGTYTVTFYATNSSGTSLGSTTWTVTVAAVASAATGASTLTSRDAGASTTSPFSGTTEGTDSTTVYTKSSATIDTAPKAVIMMLQKNATLTAGESVTVTVTGNAYISQGASAGTTKPTTTALTVKSNATTLGTVGTPVYVWSNGTAGTATVTFTTISGLLLGSKTYTFTGAVTGVTVNESVYKPRTIVRSGGYTSGTLFYVKATDANGNSIRSQSWETTLTSDAAVIASASVGAYSSTYGGYAVTATSAVGSTSGKSATLTFRVVDPSVTTSTAYLTVTKVVTLGGSVNKEVVTLDKTSYAPGEAMVVTIKATDSLGNPVYDGAATPTLVGNKALGGTLSLAGHYAGGYLNGSASSVSLAYDGTVANAVNLFAPAAEGDFVISGTSSDAAGTAVVLSVTGTVVGSGQDAIDAANEATDAANAATDAANAAAEAADAATAAAQDAQAAVAALATQVSSLIAGIKAQITSLTNLVIKIQKKVKA